MTGLPDGRVVRVPVQLVAVTSGLALGAAAVVLVGAAASRSGAVVLLVLGAVLLARAGRAGPARSRAVPTDVRARCVGPAGTAPSTGEVVLPQGATGEHARSRPRPAAVAPVASAVVGAVVGFALASLHLAATSSVVLDRAVERDEQVAVAGWVAVEPRVDDGRWWTLVTLTSTDGDPLRHRALLRGRGGAPPLWSTLEGDVRLRHVREKERRWLAGHHARYVVRGSLEPDERTPQPWLGRATSGLRRDVREAAAQVLPQARAGLATGLVTGDTSLLDAGTVDQLRASGLSHLVAVSGSNVALVLAGVRLLASLLTLGRRTRTVVSAAAVVAFVVLTRFEPSVLRASAMVGLVLLGDLRGVLGDTRHALVVAVLLVVLVDPLVAPAPGFLLSVGATAGVLVVAPALAARVPASGRAARGLVDAVAITVGAQVGVLPLLVVGDGVPLASVPANLVAVPAAAVASTMALAASVVVGVVPPLARLLLAAATWPLGVVLGTAEQFADRGPVLALVEPWPLVGFVVLLVAVAMRRRPRRHEDDPRIAAGEVDPPPRGRGPGRAARLTLAAVGAGLLLGWRLPAPPPADGLRITALDVGQGDAVLVRTPGATVLVDTGPASADVGRLLRAERVRHLDLLVVTHGDGDHVGGLADVLSTVRVDAVWARPPSDEHASDDALAPLREDGAPPVAGPVAGDHVTVGDLRLDVLAPVAGRPWGWTDREDNETSIVLRASWGGRSALLAGDVERHAQGALLATGTDLRADVLLVPHHGSRTSDAAFLRATAPSHAIVSAGRDNPFGHPHTEVIDVVASTGATIHRTDLDGTVDLVLPAAGRTTPG